MIGCIPYTYGGIRQFAFTRHVNDLEKLYEFGRAIQQEFTIAKVPFCEVRMRKNIIIEPQPVDGYGFHQKVIITFKVNGERFGFPILAPRSSILTPEIENNRARMRVTQEAGERFAQIYPENNVEFETGWLCY